MNTIKKTKIVECRVLYITGAFWNIMDSIDDQNVRENFLKNLLGLSNMEDVEKIREAKEATPSVYLDRMIKFLDSLKKKGVAYKQKYER